jgi:oxalate---CoA ligase
MLAGRLKEIVNRGGEKISSREVEEALMDHPAVLQALAFAVRHPMLGEDGRPARGLCRHL